MAYPSTSLGSGGRPSGLGPAGGPSPVTDALTQALLDYQYALRDAPTLAAASQFRRGGSDMRPLTDRELQSAGILAMEGAGEVLAPGVMHGLY